MSRAKTIRDETRALIAALPALSGITVSAVWIPPERERRNITGTVVEVATAERRSELLSRAQTNDYITIHAAVIAPLTEQGDREAEAEAAQQICEAILDGCLGKRLPSGATCTQAGQTSIADPNHWRQIGLFASIIEITWRT